MKLGFNRAKIWYEHEPESLVENENFKILWNFTIQCDHMIEARRSDIVVIDEAIPEDTRVCDKEQKKIEKYSWLKDKIARL